MSAIDPGIAGQLAASLPRHDFLRIIRAFEADLARLAREFGQAVAAADAEGHRRAAHSLAGAAAGIGAHRLEAAARRAMEPACGNQAETLAGLILEEAEAALAALSALAEQAAG